jgi:hypothetical protein
MAVQFGPKSMARASKIFFVCQVNVKLAKGNVYSHVARRVLLVYHAQLHGLWLSTEKKDKDKRICGRNISPKFSCLILLEFSQKAYGKFQSFVASFVSLRIRSELCELIHSLPPGVPQKSVVLKLYPILYIVWLGGFGA